MANDSPIVPSQSAWDRVRVAVKKVEAGIASRSPDSHPPYRFPAVVYQTTGEPDVDGFYPGVIMAWDSVAQAWVETVECYVMMADTI